MNIAIVCPVRNATEITKAFMDMYVAGLEERGHKVHYPPRDLPQEDPTGLSICIIMNEAIVMADEVHVWWDPASFGSHWDMAQAFAYRKRIVLLNKLEQGDSLRPSKSYYTVLKLWPWGKVRYGSPWREIDNELQE